ncbi:MAG: sugar phosphate isomerase/epimerase [Proteobacteria bacterium]|nr:sugar phosphate isomerase/epimerase [Pseudomonadota bacterium]
MLKTSQSIHLGGTAKSPDDVKDLHDMGLQFAEIPIIHPEEFVHQIEAYQRLKHELGIYYLCHGPREGDPNDLEALDESYFPRILKILPIMGRLGMFILTIHLWLDSRFVRQAAIDFKVQLLQRILDKAQDAHIMVCLENLSERASDMEIPFERLPLLNMTLDLGHAQLLTEENRAFGFLSRYPDKVRHIHMHDNRGGDSYLDDAHLCPGEGIIDFKRIFQTLRDIGYTRTISLELRPSEIRRCLDDVRELLSF